MMGVRLMQLNGQAHVQLPLHFLGRNLCESSDTRLVRLLFHASFFPPFTTLNFFFFWLQYSPLSTQIYFFLLSPHLHEVYTFFLRFAYIYSSVEYPAGAPKGNNSHVLSHYAPFLCGGLRGCPLE